MNNQLLLTYGMQFRRVAHPCDQDPDGQFWVYHVSPNLRITVLQRMTGFGFMEWETGFSYGREDFVLIAGDNRIALTNLTEPEVFLWLESYSHCKNTLGTILDIIAPAGGECEQCGAILINKHPDNLCGDCHCAFETWYAEQCGFDRTD